MSEIKSMRTKNGPMLTDTSMCTTKKKHSSLLYSVVIVSKNDYIFLFKQKLNTILDKN